MKIFQSMQRNLEPLGVLKSQPIDQSVLNPRNISGLFAVWLFSVLAGIFLVFNAKSFGEFADAYYGFSTVFGAVLNYTYVVAKMPKVFKLIQGLEDSIQNRLKNSASRATYGKVIGNIEKCSNIFHFMLMRATTSCVFAPYVTKSFIVYLTTDAGNDSFSLPFPIWLPFDWTNPFGYLAAFSIQIVSLHYVLLFTSCYMSLFIGTSLILIEMAKDMKEDLITLSNGKDASKNPMEFKRKLCEIIEFYSNVKQISHEFVEVYETAISIFFLWSVTTICTSLLKIQLELESEGNHFMLVTLGFLMFWSVSLVFFLCEFGQRIGDEFDKLPDVIYRSNWYSCPVIVQRFIPVILISTQDSITLSGFGNVLCSREMFKKIVNGGFSYFMTLRQFRK